MTTSHAHDEDTRKVADPLGRDRLAMPASTAPDGGLTGRPMALRAVACDGKR